MTRIIAIASQKGGVGKTTTAVHLSAYLAQAGRRVLVVDLDPQGNATSGLSVPPASPSPLAELWSDSRTWLEAAVATEVPGLSVVPSPTDPDPGLTEADLRGPRVAVLRDALLATEPAWDTVLLDCPPSLGPLTHLALSWADEVLVPVQCEYFAMEGLTQMLRLIEQADEHRSQPLEITGILFTLFSAHVELSIEVVEEVRKFFPQQVLETIIPRDVALAEAASHGQPICRYAPRARGAWAYLNLAKELLEHECEKTG